jgi:hypothetical protein
MKEYIFKEENVGKRPFPNFNNMTKKQALMMEQLLVERQGLLVKGGKLKNIINAVSSNNVSYVAYVDRAEDIIDYLDTKAGVKTTNIFKTGDVCSLNTPKGKYLLQYVDNYYINTENDHKKLLFKVFYKAHKTLVKNLEEDLKSEEFFYAKLGYFYEEDLEIANELCGMQTARNYEVFNYNGIPEFTKAVDITRGMKLVWRLFDADGYAFNIDNKDKYFKQAHPHKTLFPEEIALMLTEGWTLDSWEEYQQNILNKMTILYSKLNVKKQNFEDVLKTIPTKIWKKEKYINKQKMAEFNKAIFIIIENIKNSKNITEEKTKNKSLMNDMKALNAVDDKYEIIYTKQREELIEFFTKVCIALEAEDRIDYIDRFRTW